MAGSFRIVPHIADTGLDVTASTFAELLETAAEGMFTLMFDLESLQPDGTVEVPATGYEAADLVVGLLAELITVSDVTDVVPTAFTVTHLAPGSVRLRASTAPRTGIPLLGPPIKAVTYHALSVHNPEEGGWEARVIFDV